MGAVGLVAEHFLASSHPILLSMFGPFVFLLILGVVVSSALLWSSKFGKIRIRDSIINSISWRGDESVLDVGCGSGLMLIGAGQDADQRRINSGC